MKQDEFAKCLIHDKIQKMKKQWDNSFSKIDCLLIATGIEEFEKTKKQQIFQQWFFDTLFTNTIILINPNNLIMYTSQENSETLQQIISHHSDSFQDFKVQILINNNKHHEEMEKLQNCIKELKWKRFGIFRKDKCLGKIIELLEEIFIDNDWQQIDINREFKKIISNKSPNEINAMMKCGQGTNFFFNKFQNLIEEIVDKNIKITHQDISKNMDEYIQEKMQDLKIKFNIDPFFFNYSYTPIVQSGRDFDLKMSKPSDDQLLQNNIIILDLGCKYHNIHTRITRSIMINPDQKIKELYESLQYLQKLVIENIQINSTYKEVYLKSRETFLVQNPEYDKNIPQCFGYGIGYQKKESLCQFQETVKENDFQQIKIGQSFFVYTFLKDIFNSQGEKFSIALGDTVILNNQGKKIVVTDEINSNFEMFGYDMNENSVEFKQDLEGEQERQFRRQQKQKDQLKNLKIEEAQRELLNQKMIELEQRLKTGNFINRVRRDDKIVLEKMEAYKNGHVPDVQNRKNIHVDLKKFCVLLPIEGIMVPFHVSCIKNVTKHTERDHILIRFNFQTPQISTGQIIFPDISTFGSHPIFIKELIYKSTNIEGVSNIMKRIRDLQKQYKLVQSIGNEENYKIKISDLGMKLKVLSQLQMRPTLTGRKTMGNLELHKRGFIFQPIKGETFLLPRSNIKHAIYQPCEDDMIIIIHFLLKKPVLINKKLTEHIQFYAEVGYTSEDLNDPNRNKQTFENEVDEEQQEKEARNNYNKLFNGFVELIEDKWHHQILFDKPIKNLRFLGSPFYNNVFLTISNYCLMSISERPFLVIMLDEIELISIERIDNKIKNFDMIIIFKDYTKPVQSISNIPRQHIEMLKIWLTQEEIVFFEGGTVNLKWDKFLKKIVDDPEKFILEEGGWHAFADYSDDETEPEDPDFNENDIEEEEHDFASDLENMDEDGFDESFYSEDYSYYEEQQIKPDRIKPEIIPLGFEGQLIYSI